MIINNYQTVIIDYIKTVCEWERNAKTRYLLSSNKHFLSKPLFYLSKMKLEHIYLIRIKVKTTFRVVNKTFMRIFQSFLGPKWLLDKSLKIIQFQFHMKLNILQWTCISVGTAPHVLRTFSKVENCHSANVSCYGGSNLNSQPI